MEEVVEIWEFTDTLPTGESFRYYLEKRGTLYNLGSDDPGFQERQSEHSSPKLLALLEFLVCSNGRTLTRDEIQNKFWKRAKDGRTLDTYLMKLRRLLNDDSRPNRRGLVLNGRIIETLSGGGIRFAPKVLHPTEALPETAGGTIAVTAVLIDYLKRVINDCGELPRYYPARLRCNSDLGQLWQDVCVETRRDNQQRDETAQLTRGTYTSPGLMTSQVNGLPPLNITSTWTTVREEQHCRQVVILGDAGSGKSWLLRCEARRIAQTALSVLQSGLALEAFPEIPVLQHLADLYELVSHDQTLVDAVLANLKGEGAPELLRETIATLFRSGRVTLLLDAWDEVAAGVEVANGTDARALLQRRIEQFSKVYPGRMLLSSRKVRYSGGLMPQATELHVLPLKFAQIRRLLRSWFEVKAGAGRWSKRQLTGIHSDATDQRFALDHIYSVIRRNKNLSQLLRSPLMLALLCCSSERHGPGITEMYKALLYERLLNGLLFEWRTDDKLINVDQFERSLRLSQLSRAAWAAQLRVQLGEIELARSLGFDPIIHASQAREAIAELKQTGMLVEAGAGKTMFLHRSFQEYLTAAYIAAQPDAVEQIKQLAGNPDWKDVLTLAGSLVDRPFDLVIALLADRSESTLWPSNFSLARCIWWEAVGLIQCTKVRTLGAWDLGQVSQLLFLTEWKSVGKIARMSMAARERGESPTLDEVLRDLPGVVSSRPPEIKGRTLEDIGMTVSESTKQLKEQAL